MDLHRLLHPRSIAVVGATDREESYGGQTLINLEALGYPGQVWGVNPKREQVHGFACFPSLAELPGVPDAIVVSVPAASVPGVIDQAGELGCGGAVVYGAGFAEVEGGRALEDELIANARRHELPVCGPNGNGIVSFPDRVALWGDAVYPREPGEIAIISQSGNQAVNAISVRRGLRFHTVISCGNAAVIEPAEFLLYLAEHEQGIRSVALNLETDGDGAVLCEALAACIDAGIGVAVTKAGSSEVGAAAAAAHTGAVAGDQRAFGALLTEAGAAQAADFHDLLELAKTLALRRPPKGGSKPPPGGGGLAVMTCSGGDSSSAGDEAERRGLPFPAFSEPTVRRLAELVPHAATIQNPLDYTAMIWGERERLRDLIATVAEDPAIERVLIFYDEPIGLYGDTKTSWDAVLGGILDGAAASDVPVVISSTLPELLQDDSAARMIETGVPGVAGLRTGIACAAALGVQPGDPARLREIAALTRRARSDGPTEGWLAEHSAKELLREAGIPVVDGRLASDAEEAVAILAELGGPVVAKLSGEELQHKSELGALELDLATETEVRDAHGRLVALGLGAVLVERHVPTGVELLVAARRDGVVPTLVVGLGGVWTEALSDAAVVPLPATPEEVERALRGLRGAALLTGRRGRPELDIAAAARLAVAAGELLVEADLELLELNPVVVYEEGAVVVDALARYTASVPRDERGGRKAVGEVGAPDLQQDPAGKWPQRVPRRVQQVQDAVAEAALELPERLVQPRNRGSEGEAEAGAEQRQPNGRAGNAAEGGKHQRRSRERPQPEHGGPSPSPAIAPPTPERGDRGVDRDRASEQHSDRRARQSEPLVEVERDDELENPEHERPAERHRGGDHADPRSGAARDRPQRGRLGRLGPALSRKHEDPGDGDRDR